MYFKHWQHLKVLDLVSSTPNQAFFAYQILYFTDSNVTTIKQWLQRPASLLIHFEVYFFQTFLADVFITLWGLSYQWRWAQCLHSLCGITICHYSFYIIFLKMVILLTGYYLHFEHRRQFLQFLQNTGLGLGFGGRAGGRLTPRRDNLVRVWVLSLLPCICHCCPDDRPHCHKNSWNTWN